MVLPFRRRMPNRLPIDGRDPTILGGVEMHHPVRQEFVRLAVVRGVIGVEREGHPLAKLERLSFQVPTRAGAGQAQTVFIVEVLEVSVHVRVSHEVTPSACAAGILERRSEQAARLFGCQATERRMVRVLFSGRRIYAADDKLLNSLKTLFPFVIFPGLDTVSDEGERGQQG
jgi:hypothetical protein